MKFPKQFITAIFLWLPFLGGAQAEMAFNNIQLDAYFEDVSKKLGEISGACRIIEVANPIFPLANKKESHLVCSDLKTKRGNILRAVFTFADDRLKYIEAHGNVINTLAENCKDTARAYLNYEIYAADKLFIQREADLAWIMTEEGMHPNLFTWNNPYLNDHPKDQQQKGVSDQIPQFLNMGAPLHEIGPVLESHSSFTTQEELDGSDPYAQLQINCFGVDYLGFPRKLEARFGNEKLNVVWILTAKAEEDRIRKSLTEQFGAPIFVNDDWEIFNNWQVGLRKDKPEVLLIEQELGLMYKSAYFKQ